MLIKKLGALLLSLTLAAACIPGTLASAEEAAWFDIEAENGTLTSSEGHLTDTSTGRGYIVAYQGVHTGNTATNTFTREYDGTYDVWAVVGGMASGGADRGGYTFTLDSDTELGQIYMDTAYTNSVGDTLYSVTGIANMTAEMRWVKIASEKTVAAGSHSLVSAITRSRNHEGNKMGAIDVVRFVPSSWNWTPDSSFDAPTDMTPVVKTNNDLVLEAEDAHFSGYVLETNSSASGGKLLDKGTTLSDVTSVQYANDYQITFDFKTEAASDDYEIWALTSNVGTHTSTFEYFLDNETMGSASLTGSTIYADSNAGFPGYSHSMQWGRVGVVTMASGKHTLNIKTKTSSQYNGRILAALDCVRIVPIGMDFDKTKINDPTSTAKWFQIEAEDGVDTATTEVIAKSTWNWCSGSGVIRAGYGKNSPSNTATFGVRNAGKYDVYAVIAFGDKAYGSPENVKYTFTFNSGEPFYEKRQQSIEAANEGAFVNSLGLNGGVNFDVKWVKIGSEIELSGKTVLGYAMEGHGIIDCIRIVPSSWGWKPTGANFDDPVAPEVVYDSFTLTGDVAANGAMTATVTNIGKTVEDARNAVVIVAVYKDDKLVDVAPSAVTALTSEGQTITANVTLPSDVDGVTVKAFLWDGLSAGMPYADFIAK